MDGNKNKADILGSHNDKILSLHFELRQDFSAKEVAVLEVHLKAISKELTELRLKYLNKLDDGPPAP